MSVLYGYGRASTDRQQITLLAQEEVCMSYLKLRVAAGDDLTWGGWHPDPAVTSKLPFFDRPMGAKLLGTIRPGDVIVISNFDRIFRSVRDCDATIKLMNSMEVRLAILDIDIRTDTALGKAFMNIIAVIKELERDDCSRRTREALQYKARQGQPINLHAPIGWKVIGSKKDSKYVPNSDIRRWCYEIVRLHEEKGWDFKDITKRFKERNVPYFNPRSTRWKETVVRWAYVAAKCGFPVLRRMDLPRVKQFKRYQREHGGRPPQLARGAVSEGLLHTLPPMKDRKPISLEPVDPKCP